MARDRCWMAVAALFTLTAAGCWRSSPPPVPPTAPAAPATVVASMRAIGLDGKPVAGMLPIATREANAFDKPMVQGEPTNADGVSALAIPTGERLFLRMWDPMLKRFANNFYEVQPGGKLDEAAMAIVMVPGASLDMTLSAPNAGVDIMMLHPTQGAWWPARATADAAGRVHFDAVPAGVYTVRIKTPSSGTAELNEVKFQPGGATDLGPVPLGQ